MILIFSITYIEVIFLVTTKFYILVQYQTLRTVSKAYSSQFSCEFPDITVF